VLKDIVDVKPLEGHRLWLRFEDGAEGIIDLAELIPLSGVFAALRDRAEFVAVRVDPELSTVRWPGGADLDPDVFYSVVTRRPIPSLEAASQPKSVG
jgi:hypothetical protein